MKNIIKTIVIFTFLGISLNAQVAVVVNKSVSESSLNAAKLGNIYSLSSTKWEDGSKVVVFDQSTDGDVKNKFMSFIGKDALGLRKEWMRKQLTGEAKAPKALGSDADVISKVSSTKGAIGYIDASSVVDAVKVVATIK